MTSHVLLYVMVVSVTWLLFLLEKKSGPRQVLMLCISYLLYASWGWKFLGLLILSSLLNYGLGEVLRRKQSVTVLWAGIILNVAVLGAFKYLPAVLPMLPAPLLGAALADIVLPIGISFWTFQALSYLFDVYQGEDAEPTLLEFLLYMAFWPTVLSGPICRLPNMVTQFRKLPEPSGEDVRCGLDRIFIGLVMTALGQALASGDQFGYGLDQAFDGIARGWTGLDVWCMAVGFGFELFFNFAGYSHMVIGAARLFGFRLDENFARPFLATSPSEFWTRWHMSLSFWIRDYVFLPIAMLRREKWWGNVALMVSMIIFGLWHKGSLLFLLWGTYQGLLLICHRQWQQLWRRSGWRPTRWISAALGWLITFGAICLGFILFRANDVSQAMEMLGAVVTPGEYNRAVLPPSLYLLVIVSVLGYFALIGADHLRQKHVKMETPIELRLMLYAVAIYFGFLHAAQTQGFIYFQF